MKLILESWRQFLVEQKEFESIDLLLNELYPGEGWFVQDRLGAGQGGEVFLIQNEKTIEKRALKVVQPSSRFYDKEAANYEWVLNNRDTLPEDVKKYLPNVFSVKRSKSGVDLIQMEVLQDAPQQVLDDLIVPHASRDSQTKRKDDIILSDMTAVKDILERALKFDLERFVSTGPKSHDRIIRLIVSAWKDFYDQTTKAVFPDEEMPKSIEMQPNWEEPREKLIDITARIFKPIIQSFWEANPRFPRRSLKQKIDNELDSLKNELRYNLEDMLGLAVIPLSVGDTRKTLDPEKRKLFPEAQGLLSALEILKKDYKFIARDIHSKNVMARPESGDLVIVDLGLFVRR